MCILGLFDTVIPFTFSIGFEQLGGGGGGGISRLS